MIPSHLVPWRDPDRQMGSERNWVEAAIACSQHVTLSPSWGIAVAGRGDQLEAHPRLLRCLGRGGVSCQGLPCPRGRSRRGRALLPSQRQTLEEVVGVKTSDSTVAVADHQSRVIRNLGRDGGKTGMKRANPTDSIDRQHFYSRPSRLSMLDGRDCRMKLKASVNE